MPPAALDLDLVSRLGHDLHPHPGSSGLAEGEVCPWTLFLTMALTLLKGKFGRSMTPLSIGHAIEGATHCVQVHIPQCFSRFFTFVLIEVGVLPHVPRLLPVFVSDPELRERAALTFESEDFKNNIEEYFVQNIKVSLDRALGQGRQRGGGNRGGGKEGQGKRKGLEAKIECMSPRSCERG